MCFIWRQLVNCSLELFHRDCDVDWNRFGVCSIVDIAEVCGWWWWKECGAEFCCFFSFDVALLIVGMWCGVGVESIYFFANQIFLSSASSMNFLHVLCFALFTS